EDVPADEPAGQGEGEFRGRAEGPGSGGAVGVGTVGQSAAQFHGVLQGVNAVAAVAADVQRATAAVTASPFDVEMHPLEGGALRPAETHRPLLAACSGFAYPIRSRDRV